MRRPGQRDAGCGSLDGEREKVSALEAAVAPPEPEPVPVPLPEPSPQLEPAAGGGEAGPGQAGERRACSEMSVLPLPSPAMRPKEAEVR